GAAVPGRGGVTSRSLAGLWAAVDAGLGLTVRSAAVVPSHLKRLTAPRGLPALPSVRLGLLSAGGEPSPAAAKLKEILQQTLKTGLARRPKDARQSLARSR